MNFFSRSSKTTLVLLVVVLVLAMVGISVWYLQIWLPKTNKPIPNQVSLQTIEDADDAPDIPVEPEVIIPNPERLRVNTLFFGDVFWGRYIDDWSKASPLGTAYPFSGLDSFQRDQYDAWIGGLECPITDTYLSSSQQDSLLKFSCPVEYTAQAAKWFTAFTLANNHTDNMQEVDGFAQTQKYLDQQGIQYFGHFDNGQTNQVCQVLSLPATGIYTPKDQAIIQDLSPNLRPKYSLPFVFCGYHNVFRLPTQSELEIIQDFTGAFPVIAMPHQGAEYSQVADSLQRSVSRQMIDLGADMVVGNHVHTVQDTEAYKGRLIVYSLGNFIFDQQSSNLVREGIALNAGFEFTYDDNLRRLTELSPACKLFMDDCLQKSRDLGLNKPEMNMTYQIIATDNSDKLAKKAQDPVQQRMLLRTRWDITSAALESKI